MAKSDPQQQQQQQQQQQTSQRPTKPHPTLPSLAKPSITSTGLPSPALPEKTRKAKYVDALVETTALVINSIWNTQPKKTKLVTLRVFIQEVLRRSRTTYSTLQTALFYLFRVKNLILERQKKAASKDDTETATFCVPTSNSSTVQCNEDDLINCGRRMFLASLMIASKYLQDKNYRNKAWAKIAGLSVAEINATEIAFLNLISYNLFISKSTFERWYALLHGHVNALCVEGGSFREEANMSLAGDILFQVSTDSAVPYDSPLPSPMSPNPPRLPSPTSVTSSSSSSSSRSMHTPDSGVFSALDDWTSPVEGSFNLVDSAQVKLSATTRATQHYQSPSPSPPRKAPPLHDPLALRRQATTQYALRQNATVNIHPSNGNGNGKRTLEDHEGFEEGKRIRGEDDGYNSGSDAMIP